MHLGLIFGSFVPKYWIHSRLEQLKNAESPIELTDEGIETDFNSEHLKNVIILINVNWESSLNETFSNFEHPLNAPIPIESTNEGIEIDFNYTQPSNALCPIVVNSDFSLNKILSNFEHPENASFPIESTNEGIEIDFNSPQKMNALSPIFVNCDSFSNEIFVKFEHLKNAPIPIESTNEGIEININISLINKYDSSNQHFSLIQNKNKESSFNTFFFWDNILKWLDERTSPDWSANYDTKTIVSILFLWENMLIQKIFQCNDTVWQ